MPRPKARPLWAAGFTVHVAAPAQGTLLWIIDGSGLSCQCAGSGTVGAFLHPNNLWAMMHACLGKVPWF